METRDARSMLIGVGLGAAVAYLFDPVSGRGRRTRLRDRAKAKARRAQREAERKEQYLRNAAQGLRSQLKSPGPDDRNPDDLKLEDRIRSTVFGRPDIRDDRLVLEVEHGVVILRGEVDSEDQKTEVSRRISSDPGVREVLMLVHLPGEPAPNKEEAIRASHGSTRSSS